MESNLPDAWDHTWGGKSSFPGQAPASVPEQVSYRPWDSQPGEFYQAAAPVFSSRPKLPNLLRVMKGNTNVFVHDHTNRTVSIKITHSSNNASLSRYFTLEADCSLPTPLTWTGTYLLFDEYQWAAFRQHSGVLAIPCKDIDFALASFYLLWWL